MKKVFLVLALMSFVFALPMYANADIIGNVTLKETFQTGGSVSFNSGAVTEIMLSIIMHR